MRQRLLILCICSVLLAACNKKTGSENPFLGSWKMPNSGATFVFNADKTAIVNGKSATWTEDSGIISINVEGRNSPMRITVSVSKDGKTLSVKNTSSQTLPTMEFQKQ